MGTNFPDFLKEANRVLKKGGTLFVAEVLSRFATNDVKVFSKHMKDELGFRAVKVNKLKDFFYVMVYQKERESKKVISEEFYNELKPCLYKKR